MQYRDRVEAGRRLVEMLEFLRGEENLLVLGIPRGGVVTAAEVAKAFHAELDVWLARKIGAPANPEFAIGSISVDGELTLDRQTADLLGVQQSYIDRAVAQEREELSRRMLAFRGSIEPISVQGRTVLLVDDGIATGSTALSALASLKRAGAVRRVLAVPVAPLENIRRLEEASDQLVVGYAAPDFYAVGQFYQEFRQVSDEEVIDILAAMRKQRFAENP